MVCAFGLAWQVEWQIFSHYSLPRQAWTRGLLLVEKSMGKDRQSLEFTAQECKLRKKVAGKWTTMEDSQLLYLPEGGDYVSGFNLTRLVSNNSDMTFEQRPSRAPKGVEKVRWDAKLLMNTKRGFQTIATVQLRCFPGRHMDIQVVRERMSDARFIRGQLGHHVLHTSKRKDNWGHWRSTSMDEEFKIAKSWTDLGGSSDAALYFVQVDLQGAALASSTACSPEAVEKAKQICLERMGQARHADEDFLEDCVSDVCAGDEAAAELAADLFSDSK